MATSVLGSPSFLASDLMASRVDLTPIFWLATTLCECGNVAVTSAEVCEGVDVGQHVAGDVAMEQPVISCVDSPWQVAGDVAMEQPVISCVDSPWQVAAAKMDALPAQPTIDCERLTPGVCMLDNHSGIFQLVSPMGQVYKPDPVLLDSSA
jgi:hypothetical protein